MFSSANFALQLIGGDYYFTKELDSVQLWCQILSAVIAPNKTYLIRGIKHGFTAGVTCNVFLSSRKLSLPFSLIEKIVQLI